MTILTRAWNLFITAKPSELSAPSIFTSQTSLPRVLLQTQNGSTCSQNMKTPNDAMTKTAAVKNEIFSSARKESKTDNDANIQRDIAEGIYSQRTLGNVIALLIRILNSSITSERKIHLINLFITKKNEKFLQDMADIAHNDTSHLWLAFLFPHLSYQNSLNVRQKRALGTLIACYLSNAISAGCFSNEINPSRYNYEFQNVSIACTKELLSYALWDPACSPGVVQKILALLREYLSDFNFEQHLLARNPFGSQLINDGSWQRFQFSPLIGINLLKNSVSLVPYHLRLSPSPKIRFIFLERTGPVSGEVVSEEILLRNFPELKPNSNALICLVFLNQNPGLTPISSSDLRCDESFQQISYARNRLTWIEIDSDGTFRETPQNCSLKEMVARYWRSNAIDPMHF